VDAVALNEPDRLPDEFVIDRAKMVEKVLEDPLTPILNPMRWSFEDALDQDTYHEMATDEDQQGLTQFA